MLVSECADWSGKKILVSVINYGNEDEVVAFADHLAKQTAAGQILLSVTANKWSEKGSVYLEEALNRVAVDVVLRDPGENLGYLNGTLLGYDCLRKDPTFSPKWVAVSNTDIEFAGETFFEDLLSANYPDEVGCIAPSVYVPATGAYENPRYKVRFTKPSLEKRIKIYSSPLLFGIQQRLGAIKAGRARGAERDSQYAYLAHGCCFFLIPELAEALCDMPYGTLLYSEEAYVAEMGIAIGKRVFYDRSLKLFHHENAVTGKLGSKQRAKMYADSLSLIVRQFYHDGPVEKPYSHSDVCAVIVSYNDASRMERNIRSLREDGIAVTVVDNGSDAGTVEQLRQLQRKHRFELLCNGENRGIAAALQQGLMYAYDHGYALLLTLDQDSILCEGAVGEMIRVLNADASVASVGPDYSEEYISAEEKTAEYVGYLITSGNLVKVNAAVCTGGFDESLFIDSVDFDFSLQLRRNGFQIAKAHGAHLQHSIGEKYTPDGALSFAKFEIHSPLRYYYMVRNHIVLCRRYGKIFPGFCIKKSIAMAVELLKVLVVFPEKKRYLAAVRLGRQDAKRNILGKCTASF